MIFFIISILALFAAGLLAYKANGLNVSDFLTSKDFVYAKSSLYRLIRFAFALAYFSLVYGTGRAVGEEHLSEYLPAFVLLGLLLGTGVGFMSFLIWKLKGTIGKNVPIETLERA